MMRAHTGEFYLRISEDATSTHLNIVEIVV